MPISSPPATLRERVAARWRPVRRTVLARRRPIAAVLTATAVIAGFRATAAPPPPTIPVVVAARDLPAGAVLGAADVRTARFAPGTAPEDVATDPVGRAVAGPVGAGEPITDTRLLGPGLSESHPGTVAMPVRFPDSAMADLLRVGDRVDLLAADPQGGPPESVTEAALVLALPKPPAEAAADGLPGRLVVLGVSDSDVPDVVDASVTGFLAYAYSR